MGGTSNRLARWREARLDRGASLVEMALITPFILLLVLGALDASFLLYQNLDVRHAAREAGRLAAVNHGSSSAIATAVCGAMDNDNATQISFAGASGDLGDEVTAKVDKNAGTLVGFIDFIINPPVGLSYTSHFRLESPTATWSDGTYACP